MPKSNSESDRKAVLDSLLLKMPSVVDGKLFGYPAYYANGKLFDCIYGEGVGLKIPENIANKLLSEDHVVPFQPLGKSKMREWVQINPARSAAYAKALNNFLSSVAVS